MKLFWVKAQKGVDDERSRAKLIWTADSQSFQYARPGLPFLKIELSMLRKLTHNNLGELNQCFEQLFPSTFPASRALTFPWGRIFDDASSPESFLDAPEIWDAWMGAAITELKHAYMDPSETRHCLMVKGKLSWTSVDGLAALDQRFQEAFILDIQSNAAISPRLKTLSKYLYRTTSSELRHLYLMDGQLVLYGGCQKGESRRNGHRELMVRVLCRQARHYILPYLGLVRAALISIFQEARWHVDLIPMYQTHVIAGPFFYNAHSKSTDFSHVARPWHVTSKRYFGTELSILDKRQIDTGVHNRFFPELLRVSSQTARTVSDGLGDHGSHANANFYGRSSNLCRGLRAVELDEYIMTCQAHHSLMQTGPIDLAWSPNILQAVPFHRSGHTEIAIDTASVLVPHYYKFHQLPDDEIGRVVKEICSSLPFLIRQVVSDISTSKETALMHLYCKHGKIEIYLDDHLLLAIVAKLAWGDNHPYSFAVLPRGIEDVVDAAIIVSFFELILFY
jgi:hypothetical protein